jgi:hypothetical protein
MSRLVTHNGRKDLGGEKNSQVLDRAIERIRYLDRAHG